MSHWILVLAIVTSAWNDKDVAAVSNIAGFVSEKECIAAGKKTKELESFHYVTRFVCLEVKE